MAPGEHFRFRLYVAGDAPNATQALANLTAICESSVPGRYSIDVVDVFKEPERALDDGIFMTPTMLKMHPAPMRRIVGTLSDANTVLQALGLVALAA